MRPSLQRKWDRINRMLDLLDARALRKQIAEKEHELAMLRGLLAQAEGKAMARSAKGNDT